MEKTNNVCFVNETIETRGRFAGKNKPRFSLYTRAEMVQVEKQNNQTLGRLRAVTGMDQALSIQPCREWMQWLLQCGLIESSHGPRSRSGLYTDFT